MHRPHSIAHCQELKWSHRSQLRGPEQKHRDENVTKNILSPSQDTSHHHLSSAANLAVQDTVGTHGNIGGSVYQEALLCCCRWWSTGTECPEKLWSLLPGSLKAPECGHEPPTLGVPAWAGVVPDGSRGDDYCILLFTAGDLDQMTFKSPFQVQWFYDCLTPNKLA